MLLMGRLAKISAYGVLAFIYYSRHVALNEIASEQRFQACVEKPIVDDSKSPCFYTQAQVDQIHRSFLLRTNK